MNIKSSSIKSPSRVYRDDYYKKITWTIFIVKCADGTYFGGLTQNLEEELIFINDFRRGYYFNTHPERVPVKLQYEEHVPFREATAKSQYLKKMNRRLKKKLIATHEWPYGGAWKEFAEKNPQYLNTENS